MTTFGYAVVEDGHEYMDIDSAVNKVKQIDARYLQLVQANNGDLTRVIDAMANHLTDLYDIWSEATDEEIEQLFRQYPNFFSYCVAVDLLS